MRASPRFIRIQDQKVTRADVTIDIEPGALSRCWNPPAMPKHHAAHDRRRGRTRARSTWGEAISALTPNNDTAMIFQSPLPHYNGVESVAYGLRLRKNSRDPARVVGIRSWEMEGLRPA